MSIFENYAPNAYVLAEHLIIGVWLSFFDFFFKEGIFL